MAKASKPTTTIDPEKQYQVELAAPITVGPHVIHPGPNVVLSGAVIQAASAGVVTSATEIDS